MAVIATIETDPEHLLIFCTWNRSVEVLWNDRGIFSSQYHTQFEDPAPLTKLGGASSPKRCLGIVASSVVFGIGTKKH